LKIEGMVCIFGVVDLWNVDFITGFSPSKKEKRISIIA
jgi:hypothetical protein